MESRLTPMSIAGRGDRSGGMPEYRLLPPGAGRAERSRLAWLGVMCVSSALLVILQMLPVTIFGDISRAYRVLGISAITLEFSIIAAQLLIVVAIGRPAIVGDYVYGPRITLAKRIMTPLSILPFFISAGLISIEVFFSFRIGASWLLLTFLSGLFIGTFGTAARTRLRDIERFIAGGNAGYGLPPYGPQGPSGPPYRPR